MNPSMEDFEAFILALCHYGLILGITITIAFLLYLLLTKYKIMAKSTRFKLNKEDLLKVGQVILWAGGSWLCKELLDLIPSIDLPIWSIPVINSVLVFGKKFFSK